MRTMTKERKKEGPRLGHKGRADAKASRQLLLLCIPAIIGYILFNYIPMGAAVIIPFKNYKFSKGILGSDWCGLANFKWIIQSVALDRALRNTVLYGLLFMVLSPVTNVIIALLLFEITSRRRLKTYQTIITFPNFMSMVIVGYIVYAILSPRTGRKIRICNGTLYRVRPHSGCGHRQACRTAGLALRTGCCVRNVSAVCRLRLFGFRRRSADAWVRGTVRNSYLLCRRGRAAYGRCAAKLRAVPGLLRAVGGRYAPV